MELWTDDTLSEFAIMLNSNSVASTSQESKYTRIIDESPYVAGYDSNWSYILIPENRRHLLLIFIDDY